MELKDYLKELCLLWVVHLFLEEFGMEDMIFLKNIYLKIKQRIIELKD